MNIKVFMLSAQQHWEREILRKFARGIEIATGALENQSDIVRIGRWIDAPITTVECVHDDAYRECDVAVIFGSWKNREKAQHHSLRSSVANSGKTFVCIETPLLNRSTKGINQYWRVGINGFLNREATWPKMGSQDAKLRLEELGIKWDGWKNNPRGHIVIALQLPGDASLRGADINEWCYETVREIREVSDRPIVIRSHPLSLQKAYVEHGELCTRLILEDFKKITFSDGAVRSWDQDLDGAYCTVTFSSGLAVDSVVAGIPTVACDSGNFAYGISTNFPSEIEKIVMHEDHIINDWLAGIATTQYSIHDMQSGMCWKHVALALGKKR